MKRLPGLGAGHGDSADFVRVLAADGAVEVVENSFVRDDGGFVGEGFVDGAGSSGVDEYLGHFDEGVGIDTEGQHLTGAARTLVAKAKVEHGEVTAILDDERV